MKDLMLHRNPSTALQSKAEGPEVPNQGQILKGHQLKMRMMSVGVGSVNASKDLGWRGILRNVKVSKDSENITKCIPS